MANEGNELVKVIGQGHGECILGYLRKSWESDQFSNVTIICRDQLSKESSESNLLANKFVLAAASRKLARVLDETEDDVVMIVPDYDRSNNKLNLENIHSGQIYLETLSEEFDKLLREWDINFPEIFSVKSCQINKTVSKSVEASNLKEKLTEGDVNPTVSNSKGSIKVCELDSDSAQTGSNIKIKSDSGSTDNNLKKRKSTKISPENDINNSTAGEPKTENPARNGKKNVAERDDYSVEANKEMDDKFNKDDLSASLDLLKEEQRMNQEMAENICNLTDAVRRYKVYARHLLGVETPDSNLEKNDVKIACETCGKMINKNYMVEHVKTIHNTERPYLCDQCGRTFPLQTRLRVHQRIQHGELSCHKCSVCAKSFKRAAYLQKHMTLHQGVKPYACKYCDRKFRLPAVLSKHIRTHTGERPYECETCQKRFGSRSTYVNHTLTHNKKRPSGKGLNVDPVTQLLKCDVCQLNFHREYAYILHKAGHTGQTPALPCAHCDSFFPSLKLLRQHTNDAHADALYSCHQCDKKFANKTTLSTHALIHKQEDRLACDQCVKTFATKSKLLNHMKVMHSEERPFPCQSCDKTFKTKEMLHKHKRTHTDERPYVCPECPKAFRQSTHLACHLLLHTGEKPFTCQYCEKSFTHKNNLNSHIKIHTGERNQCKICDRIFPSLVKLRRHESTHQPLQDIPTKTSNPDPELPPEVKKSP